MPRCPVCFVPMTRIEEDRLRAHTCPSCFGHWMPSVALLRRVRTDVEKATAVANFAQPETPASPSDPSTTDHPAEAPPDNESTSLADMAAVVAEADSKKPLRCPECEKFMVKDRFQQMIPINIDRCKHCDRIWLDTGEYNLIRRLYVELYLSDDPDIVHLREKVAVVASEWDGRTTLTQAATGRANSATALTNVALHAIFNVLRA